jgi:hypothetical protein
MSLSTSRCPTCPPWWPDRKSRSLSMTRTYGSISRNWPNR